MPTSQAKGKASTKEWKSTLRLGSGPESRHMRNRVQSAISLTGIVQVRGQPCDNLLTYFMECDEYTAPRWNWAAQLWRDRKSSKEGKHFYLMLSAFVQDCWDKLRKSYDVAGSQCPPALQPQRLVLAPSKLSGLIADKEKDLATTEAFQLKATNTSKIAAASFTTRFIIIDPDVVNANQRTGVAGNQLTPSLKDAGYDSYSWYHANNMTFISQVDTWTLESIVQLVRSKMGGRTPRALYGAIFNLQNRDGNTLLPPDRP